jgi:hypothetical protein
LVEGKPLTATFDAGRLSSDGGVIILREIAARLGLAKAITAPLLDNRDQSRVQHGYADMALARMVMIAAGYEDCDDIDTLRTDPAFKIALGRGPDSGADLMSQPTLSRLENLAGWRGLARIGLNMIDLFCRSYAQPPNAIVLDIDDTNDPVHGQQELALFTMRTTTAPASSRSTFSRRCRESRSCQFSGRASGRRARRWRAFFAT